MEFPIKIQKIIFPILRFHTTMSQTCDNLSVYDVSQHVLGNKNKKDYKIVYENFEETDRNYELTVSAIPLYSKEYYENKFEYLKNNLKYFVRYKNHVNKFGMIVDHHQIVVGLVNYGIQGVLRRHDVFELSMGRGKEKLYQNRNI